MYKGASGRPVRRDVAAAYDRGVDAYVDVWSAVILPPAERVVAALGLASDARVADIGAGSGALVPAIRHAAPDATVIALDASVAMLRAASDRTDAHVLYADAQALPIRSSCMDAAVLAFVLFHLNDPRRALIEAARMLRAGGAVGTVTWTYEAALPAYAVWDRTLIEAGAAPLPARRNDSGLDSPEAMRDLLMATGLRPARIWTQSLHHQWAPDSYWALATGSGLNRLRLETIDEAKRADTLHVAHERLSALQPSDFAWSGEVVCATGHRT